MSLYVSITPLSWNVHTVSITLRLPITLQGPIWWVFTLYTNLLQETVWGAQFCISFPPLLGQYARKCLIIARKWNWITYFSQWRGRHCCSVWSNCAWNDLYKPGTTRFRCLLSNLEGLSVKESYLFPYSIALKTLIHSSFDRIHFQTHSYISSFILHCVFT